MLEIADEAITQLGHVDVVALNAGVLEPFDIYNFDAGVFHRHLDVHVMSAVNCVETVLPQMLDRKSGTLLLVASLAGLTPLPQSAPYCAAKSTLVSLALPYGE